jgi:hypothetical protein
MPFVTQADLSRFDVPIERLRLGDNNCFLCGNTLEDEIHPEHIFPQWLQKQFDLQNRTLTLLNGTQIPYKNLKIPCCQLCNNEHLSKLEIKIKNAVSKGYENFAKLDPQIIYQWAAKIFFGILYKELSLDFDRKNKDKGKIVNADILKSFSNLHGLLQSIRQPFRFPNGYPFSVLICNLHSYPSESFDYQDYLNLMTTSFRLGEIGIIIAFQDLSLNQNTYGQYASELNGRKIHPVQFDELFAKVSYQCSRISNRPSFTWAMSQDTSLPIDFIITSQNYLTEWDSKDYSYFLEKSFKTWDIKVTRDEIPTTMTDESGSLLLIDTLRHPISPILSP